MKILKISAYAIGGLLLLGAIVLAWFNFKGIPQYSYHPPVEVLHLQVPRDSFSVARGAAIASMHCVACHAGPEGRLIGKPSDDLPPIFGQLHSLNITKDPVHGIGQWTDGELYYFLRTGIRSDGSWAPPFMPKYSIMVDEDLYAVIAWLRSKDWRVAPDSAEYPPNRYNLLVKTLANTLFGPPPFPAAPIHIPDTSDQVLYGKYVADALSNCYACHSGDMFKVNGLQPEQSFGYYGGGIEFRTPDGQTIYSPNLTMDTQTGLGNWTVQQFTDAVRYCKKPDGSTLSRPMFPHWMLTDKEVNAIWTYLESLPAVEHPVERLTP